MVVVDEAGHAAPEPEYIAPFASMTGACLLAHCAPIHLTGVWEHGAQPLRYQITCYH